MGAFLYTGARWYWSQIREKTLLHVKFDSQWSHHAQTLTLTRAHLLQYVMPVTTWWVLAHLTPSSAAQEKGCKQRSGARNAGHWSMRSNRVSTSCLTGLENSPIQRASTDVRFSAHVLGSSKGRGTQRRSCKVRSTPAETTGAPSRQMQGLYLDAFGIFTVTICKMICWIHELNSWAQCLEQNTIQIKCVTFCSLQLPCGIESWVENLWNGQKYKLLNSKTSWEL